METVQQKSRSDRQTRSNYLLPYFLASVLIHGLVMLVIAVEERSPSATKLQPAAKQKQNNTPIEFVFVPPEKTPDKPPPETKRRAITNSVARGKIKSERPPTTKTRGNTAIDSNSAPTPKVASSNSEAKKSPSSEPAKTKPTAEAVKPTPPVVSKPRTVEPPLPSTPKKPAPKPTPPVASKPRTVEPPLPSTPKKPALDRADTAPTPTLSDRQTPPKPTKVPPVNNRLPSPTKPLQSPPQSQTSPKSPTRPTPPTRSLARKTPNSSDAASLLGGNYQRSIKQDSGSSFFASQSTASKESPYAKLDARQDDLAPYFAEIRRRVKRNWQPVSPGEERYTVLAFAIERSGQISELKVVETSGDERVDRDALEAVRKAAPFSALPQTFPSDRLEIQFSFNIYIRQGSFSPNLGMPFP